MSRPVIRVPHLSRFAVVLALAAVFARSGAGATEKRSPLDPARDPRLARRLSLQAEAIPVSRVVRLLSEKTGVPLTAARTVGDERLVAFVPDAPLAEVLERIAELYRLEWVSTGRSARGYTLMKPLSTAKEEADLRQRALRGVMERLLAGLQGAPDTEVEKGWPGTLPVALPILFSHGEELLREGAVYLPIFALPAAQRDPLVARMQPELDARHAFLQKFLSAARARMAEDNPDAQNLRFAGEGEPPPPADNCTLIAEIDLGTGLEGRVALKTGIGIEYPWLRATGDDLRAAARALYAGSHALHPPAPGEMPPAEPKNGTDPFTTPVPVASEPALRKGDWIGMLGRLSPASGLSVYADCYMDLREGIDRHPRADFTVNGKGVPTQALDRLCDPTGETGIRRRMGGFWWQSGRAALVRSGRWLWEEAAVPPASLAEQLAASLRTTHNLAPEDLPRLAALNGLQVRNMGFLSGHQDTWRMAVQFPARLSAAARKRLVWEDLSWARLSGPDQAVLARYLVPNRWARYRAQVRVNVSDLPCQGGAAASIDFRTGPEGADDQSILHLPLPGVSPDEALTPRGVRVELGAP